jgi:SNF2 family DNA or RNA helicase
MIGLPASFYTETDNLIPLARAFILKRTKKLVGINMTNVVLDKNIVQWGNQQEMRLSEEIHSALAFSQILPSKDKSKLILEAMKDASMLSMLLRARQTCIYPKLMAAKLDSLVQRGLLADNSSYREAFNCSSKIDFAVKKILERKDNGCGKLIFCHFREEIDEIATRLINGGMTNVVKIDGRTSNGKRTEILTGKNDALILQIQTGCEGLNLQENYSEIYFISPHWNPAIEDQAIARCHRIGQKKPVYVERFEMSPFTPDTAEQTMLPITVDNYVSTVQEVKRVISQQYIS